MSGFFIHFTFSAVLFLPAATMRRGGDRAGGWRLIVKGLEGGGSRHHGPVGGATAAAFFARRGANAPQSSRQGQPLEDEPHGF